MENSMMSEMSRVTVSEKGAASATIVRRIESLFLLLCIFLYCFVSSAQAVETGTGEILAMEAAR